MIETRIEQFEMAYRMQASVPDLTDLSKETEATKEMYGPDVNRPGTYAYNCLMARRMAELHAGDVTIADLFASENELNMARLQVLDAAVDRHLAQARLAYALGE